MATAPCWAVRARLTKADIARIQPLRGKANALAFDTIDEFAPVRFEAGEVMFDTFAGKVDVDTREWVGLLRFFLAEPGIERMPFDVLLELLSGRAATESKAAGSIEPESEDE